MLSFLELCLLQATWICSMKSSVVRTFRPIDMAKLEFCNWMTKKLLILIAIRQLSFFESDLICSDLGQCIFSKLNKSRLLMKNRAFFISALEPANTGKGHWSGVSDQVLVNLSNLKSSCIDETPKRVHPLQLWSPSILKEVQRIIYLRMSSNNFF